MTIITSSRQTYRDCSIKGAENDSVELTLDNEFVKLPVNSVLILILPHKSGIWENAGYGAFLGGILGTFIKIIPDEEEEKSSCIVAQDAWESLKFLEGSNHWYNGRLCGRWADRSYLRW